jgi:oligopeptide transport system permease protein
MNDMNLEKKSANSSHWSNAWRRLLENRAAVFGLIVVSLIIIACIFEPLISNYEFDQQDRNLGAKPPNLSNLFGTDVLGRDLLTRVCDGGRVSFMVGIIATVVSLTIGVLYGSLSGYIGGKVDSILMRIVDIIYALPFVIFVILLMVMFEKRSLLLVFAAIGLVEWPTMARIVRDQVMNLKKQQFVDASRCMGQSTWNILYKHLFPNILGIIIVYTTLTIPNVMLLEAFISFLGLGVQAPATSWGDLIRDGAQAMEEHPWLIIFPSLAFSLTLFSLNFLGDGLRDAFDPRSAKK